MTSAKKIYLAVAGGLVAAGVVLAGIGFIASGFDPAVFTTQIDTRDSTIVLGGVEVDDPTGLPSSSSSPESARSTPPASPRPSPLLPRRRPPLPKHSVPGRPVRRAVQACGTRTSTPTQPASSLRRFAPRPARGPMTHTQNPSEEKGTQ